MIDKTIIGIKEIGGDYFILKYLRSSKYNLEYFLIFTKNDYWIYKSTGKQKEVTYEEFLKFEYASYIFFRKDLYNRDDINKWIDFIGQFGGIMYLNKPFPKIEIINKIKIKK